MGVKLAYFWGFIYFFFPPLFSQWNKQISGLHDFAVSGSDQDD